MKKTNQKFQQKLALCLTALLTLTGCASTEDASDLPQKLTGEQLVKSESSEETTANPLVGEDGVWLGEGGCYRMSDSLWKDTMQGASAYGDAIYTYSLDRTDGYYATLNHGEGLLYEGTYVREITCGDDGIWILDDTSDYTMNQRSFTLLLLGYDGQEKYRRDITDQMEMPIVRGMCQDAEGLLFLLLNDQIAVYSREGIYQCTIPLEESGSRIVPGGDGKVYVSTTTKQEGDTTALASSGVPSGGQILRVNVQAKATELVETYQGYYLGEGGEGYLFTMISDEGLYGFTEVGGDLETIALWEEVGLIFYHASKVHFMPEGKLLLEDQNMIATLEPAEASQIKPKTVLTMAAVSRFSPFSSLVAEFNLSNDKYLVKVENYSQGGLLSAGEAIEALNLDILSGEGPDLFDFLQLPQDYYADKGLLEDLYPYMEQDDAIDPTDYIALSQLENDGKLYGVTDTIQLDTLVGLTSRFGERYGWTLDEYLELQSQSKAEILYNVTRERFLERIAARYAVKAIDWENGSCSFDNPEFIHLLECVAQVRENPEPENSAYLDFTPVERRLRESTLIAASWSIHSAMDLAEAELRVGEDLSWIGWPTPDGSSSTTIHTNRMVGISSQGNREGAWEFVKFVLESGTSEVPEWGLSLNRQVLQKQMDQAAEAYTQGEAEIPFDQEDEQQLYDLIDHAVYEGTSSDKVVEIILEEAAPFLAGDKSAEETAAIIQSRVGILAAE